MRNVLAGFESESALRRAVDRLTAERIGDIETYTPVALDEHPRGSPLPLIMFLAGMLGFVGFFLLMAYADVWSFPLNIGGRPTLAWPAFVPIAFELGILCAMGAGFLGYFVMCRMPKLYDPVDECRGFVSASRDGWFVAVRCADAQSVAQAHAVLNLVRPKSLEEFSS